MTCSSFPLAVCFTRGIVCMSMLLLCCAQSYSFRPHELQPAQAPLPTGFPRQEYWSGLPFPTPEDLPDPGMKSMSLISPALAGEIFFFLPLHHLGSPFISMLLSQFIPPSSPHPRSPTASKSLFSVRIFFFSFLKLITFGRAGFSLLYEGFL